jgi:2-keto-4-pentenoate hydratase/2-oxohepta-3-ene-1,7-dioic acid hydratase in catechol pathway
MIIELYDTSYIPRRVFCIGRNYRAHAEELNNAIPDTPVVFIKPTSALIPKNSVITMPTHGQDLHYEAELVVLVGQEGRPQTLEDTRRFIEGFSLGLDLTLRDVQSELKKNGLPWEKAKGFDASAPLGTFASFTPEIDLNNISFTCEVNGELRQQGNSGNMLFSIPTLLMELSKIWTLKPGDLIFTGTPEGIGPLHSGDSISVSSDLIGSYTWNVA